MLRPSAPVIATGERLSALDGSFLRLESGDAHMHVGWVALFAAPADGERPTVEAVRARVASRLHEVPWCRWRLATAPLGLSEPRWVQAQGFDLDAHVLAPYGPDEAVGHEAFAALRDAVLSEPLDRSRPLWQIFLIPRLDDGRVGIVGKVHHAMVDGFAALQIAGLTVDDPPGADGRSGRAWRPARSGGAPGWAIDSVTRAADDGFRRLRATLGAAVRPRAAVGRMLGGTGHALQAVREDVLPKAPLNVPIGPRRSLTGYRAAHADLRAARSRGGTLNDIGLTMVAGALRALALRRGDPPVTAFKAMVPVSMRRVGETGPGNRIAMVYVQLPVHLGSPQERLDWVRAQTQRLKRSGRAEGGRTLFDAGALLPAPLRPPVVKALGSPRTFNLTISQSPGPRHALSMLGCELQEAYSVVPITQGHALAIGMVRYRHDLFFGCYADPDALPEARELPALLEAELRALGRAPIAATTID